MKERIFHFSDFHISKDMGDADTNSTFAELVRSVKMHGDDKNSRNYIVFTGDVVDAKRKADEKDEEYKQRMADSFSLAVDYFTKIANALAVSPERVIICPGNHDKTRIDERTNKSLCTAEVNYNVDYYHEAYELFSNFYKRVTNRDFRLGNEIYSFEDFNFFIMNSTWKEKEMEREGNGSRLPKEFHRCVGCGIVKNILHSDVNNRLSVNRERNILLIHDPSTSWCKEAIVNYDDSKYIVDDINTYFGYKLCGDIHVESNIDDYHTVATLLNKDTYTYGVIEYGEGKSNYCTYEGNVNDKEKIVLDLKQKKEILSLSTKDGSEYYIKKLALKFISEKYKDLNEATLLDAISTVSSFDSTNQRWKNISGLFEIITNFRSYCDGEQKIKVEENLFSCVKREIDEGTGRTRLAVKGRPSKGKSTFLSLLYIYLFSEFIKGDFKWIPVYFNRENLINETYEDKIPIFKKFMENAKEFSESYKKPVCFILDGFHEYNYYAHSLDDYIYENYLEYWDEDDKNSIVVLSVDTDKSRKMAKTHVGQNKDATKVLFFQNIELHSLRLSTAEKFVYGLSDLMGIDKKKAKTMYQQIQKSDIDNVDMNLIVHHGKEIYDGKSLYEIYGTYGRNSNIFLPANQDLLPQCAYYIQVLNQRYDIICQSISITHKDYSVLCRQREVCMYFCAKYYFDEIKRLSGGRDDYIEDIPEESVVNHFYSHEQNKFFKMMRDNSYVDAHVVKTFIKKYYNKLPSTGKSQLLYLFGRENDETGKNIFMAANIPLVEIDISAKLAPERFNAEIANRTLRVIQAFDDKKKVEEYIIELLENPYRRRVNRATHMLYYSDVNYEQAKRVYFENVIFKGFDIYHTFLVLSNRIKSGVANSNLRLLDMFTLCDLLEHRFRKEKASNIAGSSEVDSFFYTDFYNKSMDISPKQILSCFIETVECFLKGGKNSEIIETYFEKCICDARLVLSYFTDANSRLPHKLFHQSSIYNKVSKIEEIGRTGWKIDQIMDKGATPDAIEEIINGKAELETVSQHIYQTYLIGLFYLPAKYPDNSEFRFSGTYDKQRILNTILIHDLGEAETKDWPSFCQNYEDMKKRESEFNKQMFIRGAFSEVDNLIDYLDLWNNWVGTKQGRGDINAVIAKELDKIQFLYRFNKLLSSGELKGFSDQRINNMRETENDIKTEVGRKILKQLIHDNPLWSTED